MLSECNATECVLRELDVSFNTVCEFILLVPVTLVQSLLCCKYISIYASVLLLMDIWAVSVEFALRNINPY